MLHESHEGTSYLTQPGPEAVLGHNVAAPWYFGVLANSTPEPSVRVVVLMNTGKPGTHYSERACNRKRPYATALSRCLEPPGLCTTERVAHGDPLAAGPLHIKVTLQHRLHVLEHGIEIVAIG